MAIIVPDKKGVEIAVKMVFRLMFPVNEDFINSEINITDEQLKNHWDPILNGIMSDCAGVSEPFLKSLQEMKKLLLRDANFILESDPAAKSLTEVVAIYPGFFAIFCYRLAHSLIKLSVPLLPRMITEYAHKVTGIDIHPSATIGSPFSIDHGTGIVIGETAIIGDNVKIYQGVTLGALSVDKSKASKKRHPTIEDNVILYAGCTILGGATIIGRNSIIGGNVWLTESIKPFSVVYHKSEIVVRNQDGSRDPVDFVI